MKQILLALVLVLASAGDIMAGDWSADQQAIIDAIGRLGAATRPDGGGPDAYAAALAPGYTRWTLGRDSVEDRERFIESMREWWTDGWRVVSSQTDYIEIAVHGDFATARRIVTESYRGPQGEETGSRTALSEVWVRGDDGWLALRVNTRPLDD